jgi:asparagine synthase (glutamine-hydrolysing)
MCGIAGLLVARGAVEVDGVRILVEALEHRGPDSGDLWSGDGCVLGHRRLAIIDLSEAGCQPMASADGALRLTFNGEIYNFQELRRQLEATGHRFRSATDTEVILHAWEEWGTDCVHRLRGMFAFGLWDARARRLFLARDRAGKKPLFWTSDGERLMFASELHALLQDPSVSRQVDLQAVDEYLSWGYVPAPRTGFRAVSKLPPAHWMTVDITDDGLRCRLHRYWELSYEPKLDVDEVEAGRLVREALTEAVRLRMISDVPLGAFLSGGIDSSVVVGLMAQLSSRPVRTFSIGFEEAAYDELAHARRVAQRWSTDHREEVVRPDAAAVLPLLVRHYGEPYADSSAIPTYYLARATRQHVTVALNGDGGDESFAGYDRYRANLVAERLATVPAGRFATGALARLLPDSANPKSTLRRARRFFEAARLPMASRYARWSGYFDEDAKERLYGERLAPLLRGRRPAAWMEQLFDEVGARDPVDAAMGVDVRSYLPFDLLVKVDITSMASSLEARSPFLDHEVMELAARLPTRLKLWRGTSKLLLKREFADLLPPENVNRPKMGFGVPVGEWFRGPLRPLLHDSLLGREALGRGLLREEAVRQLLDDHDARRQDHTPRLWSLLMLELWHRELVDDGL